MTLQEALDRFLARDAEAVEAFNAEFYGCTPPLEAQVQFTTGRLNDLCLLVVLAITEFSKEKKSHEILA